ncbi:pyridoxamine 5'-phosphate oxidase family protein [Streptomyces fagopyri]|uniref:pyridoxamine 5'-phosphate oxidase family protein n=1 Tax=Streptomyces fagopyri TaxID=2662397 RepID=UPI0033D93E5F
MTRFSEAERAYLKSQGLGRPATVDAHGRPQANPRRLLSPGRRDDPDRRTRDGHHQEVAHPRKNPRAALVVDDVVSLRPWKACGVDIRGEAELLTGPHDLDPHFSEELIRVHPRRIHS